MQKIHIIAVGKIKEDFLRQAFAEYEKRLSGYCDLTVTEIPPQKLPDKPRKAEISAALETEGEKILSAVPRGAYLVPMCIEGKKLDSEGVARLLEGNALSSPCTAFVIGSSYGLADSVKAAANLKLSMSDMTFPHDLARVMLAEQIYRAFKITGGGTYHK